MSNQKQGGSDLIAAVTGAVAGAPQTMGFALVAGVNPLYGLYAAAIATIVGGFISKSNMMTIAPTNALSLMVFATLSDNAPASNLFTLTVLVGLFQLGFGLFRLGFLTRFVSNAVMTGFITGAGILIMIGQLEHITGYHPHSQGIPRQLWETLSHLSHWEPATIGMGIIAIGIILLLDRTRLHNISTLVAILVVSTIGLLFPIEIATVGEIGSIQSGLPALATLDFSQIPTLASAAFAMAILSLVQSAGITQSIHPPDEQDANRDFLAQGIANTVGGFLQGMPSGGSLSRTAVNLHAGAITRRANILAGIFIGLIVITFGGTIEQIALTALAAHLIVAASSLIDIDEIKLVWNVRWSGRLAMAVTFACTLLLPLEFSIYIGVLLSLALYIFNSSQSIKVRKLEPITGGRFKETPLPATYDTGEVVLISVEGNLYFAAVRKLESMLPSPSASQNNVVILRLRGNIYLGSTGAHFLQRYAVKLGAAGGKLILAGVEPVLHEQLIKTGLVQVIGARNIFHAGPVLLKSTQDALDAAEHWLHNGKPASNAPESFTPVN